MSQVVVHPGNGSVPLASNHKYPWEQLELGGFFEVRGKKSADWSGQCSRAARRLAGRVGRRRFSVRYRKINEFGERVYHIYRVE